MSFYAKQRSARMRLEDRIRDLCSAPPSRNRWPSRRTVAGHAGTHRARREPSGGPCGLATARRHPGAREASAPRVHPYSARAFPAERLKETITARTPLRFSPKLRPRRLRPCPEPGVWTHGEPGGAGVTFKESGTSNGTRFPGGQPPRQPPSVAATGEDARQGRSEPSVAHFPRMAYFAVIGGATRKRSS